MELDARMVQRLRRGAALGAYAVTAGLVAVYAGVVALVWPVRTGGMNSTMAWITSIAAFIPVLALAAVHIVFARQLMEDAPHDAR
jgi:hypothetical protein